MSVLGVIPVRYESVRFPGKPLATLNGRPLVQWVYEAASRCRVVDRLVVATDSPVIATRVREFGGEAELTRDDHPSGTDRVAEVAERHSDASVVVNIQGDQLFVTPGMLTTLVAPYVIGERPAMATLAAPINDPRAISDSNVVKVVCDVRGYALYFSRSPIPYGPETEGSETLHHLGLYAFSRESVLAFPSLEPTPLERREGLEQLRALEHGLAIRVCRVENPVVEVNTPQDLEKAQRLLRREADTAK